MTRFFNSHSLFQSWKALGTSRQDLWRELALLAMLTLEVSWIAPWVRLIISTEKQGLSLLRAFLAVGGIYLGAYVLVRLLDHFSASEFLLRISLALFLLGSVLLGLKTLLYFESGARLGDFFRILELLNRPSQETVFIFPVAFLIAPAILFIGLRGAHLARNTLVSPNAALTYFRYGLAAYFSFGIIIATSAGMAQHAYGVQLDASPGFLFPTFVLSSLLAMSASRISGLGRLRGGRQIPFDRQRLLGVVAAVTTLGGLALLVGSLATARWVQVLFGGLLSLLIKLIAVLVAPLIWLFIQLETRLINSSGQVTPAPTPTPLATPVPLQPAGSSGSPGVLGSPLFSSPWLIWIAILLGVILIALLIRSQVQGGRRSPEIEMQPPGEQVDPLAQLLADLRRRASALSGRLAEALNLSRPGRVLAAARIRRIYAQLLDLSAELGHPRPDSRTPLEFLSTLESLFPEGKMDLTTITAAYQRIRYGELPESQAEVQAVEAAWKRVAQGARKP